jgi:predicted transcriptional regulator
MRYQKRIRRKKPDVGIGMINKIKDEIELMARHIEVARAVLNHQPIGIMKLSDLLGLPSHRIRYSLHVLEQMGYIQASPDGAVATSLTVVLLTNLDRDIDDLIKVLEQMKKTNGASSG